MFGLTISNLILDTILIIVVVIPILIIVVVIPILIHEIFNFRIESII